MPAVYRFLVSVPSPLIGSIRSLDITLVLPYAEYRPYNSIDGSQPATQLEALQKTLTEITFRDLRITLDVRDRQCWRKLPESGILTGLGKVKVLNKYIVELPALLPGQNEQHDDFLADHSTLRIHRRPPIRYWNFNPRKVERLTWKVAEGAQTACWISSDTMEYIPNPWHDAR